MTIKDNVWEYILEFELDYGHVPSLSQIAEEFKWKNRNAAKWWVDKLIQENKLKKLKKPLFIYYSLT